MLAHVLSFFFLGHQAFSLRGRNIWMRNDKEKLPASQRHLLPVAAIDWLKRSSLYLNKHFCKTSAVT